MKYAFLNVFHTLVLLINMFIKFYPCNSITYYYYYYIYIYIISNGKLVNKKT